MGLCEKFARDLEDKITQIYSKVVEGNWGSQDRMTEILPFLVNWDKLGHMYPEKMDGGLCISGSAMNSLHSFPSLLGKASAELTASKDRATVKVLWSKDSYLSLEGGNGIPFQNPSLNSSSP